MSSFTFVKILFKLNHHFLESYPNEALLLICFKIYEGGKGRGGRGDGGGCHPSRIGEPRSFEHQFKIQVHVH